MKPGDLSHTFFDSLDKDFKAEVTAAEMVEDGTAAERILILMTGAMKRSFRRDVDAIEEELSTYDRKEYVVVKTPKEGIYDMLPKGLFHAPASHKSTKTEKEIITAIKQRRAEEQNARKFFIPFEATINYLRMQVALYENRLDKRSHYDELVNIFSAHWEIFKYLDARQANIFLHLLPILHDIRDDHPVIEAVLEMIFLLPVQISLRTQMPLHPAEPILSKLGESRLSVDLTTGNALFSEGIDEIMINIGPMRNEELQQFLPGGIKNKILELLCDYLLPVHMDRIVEYELQPQDKTMRLAHEGNVFNSMLGSDTYI